MKKTKKIIIPLFLVLLTVSLINLSLAATKEPFLTLENRGAKYEFDTTISTRVLYWQNEICPILGQEVLECDFSGGEVIGGNPISDPTLISIKQKNNDIGENLITFSNLAEIYQLNGKDSISIESGKELELTRGSIRGGEVSFSDTVTVGRLINKGYPNEKIILKGTVNYDDKIITLKTGDQYHRAGAQDDTIISSGTLTIEPLVGTMNIDLDETGNFEIFGIKTFIPAGSRLQITATNAFEIIYSKGRYLNVQVTPITATKFSFVKDGEKLWLNGNGKFQLNEIATLGDSYDGVGSYELKSGVIGSGYTDNKGKIGYVDELKEIEGETYIVKSRWQDIPATVGVEKAGINIIKTLDEGVVVINEEGKFFISNEDYIGEGKTDNFFVGLYEYGKDQIEKIKQLIMGK